MLLVSKILENFEEVSNSMLKRNIDVKTQLKKIIELDKSRRETQSKLDNLLAESNKLAKEIGNFFKKGKSEKANFSKEKAALLKLDTKKLSDLLNSYINDLNNHLLDIPNIPHDLVPKGNSENDNEEVLKEGKIPE